ncbi:MAG: hypothetical protein WAN86_01780 [Hyphomicrobiaceae bacterium]
MIQIEHDGLIFRFPEVHDDAEMAIEFRRTLRVPVDGRLYKLPPSHRAFRLKDLDDCGERVPQDWIERGGVIMPLYKGEAMYMAFSGGGWVKGYPFAIKIAAGNINAISGKPWKDELDPTEQDYIVIPRQPRFYGFCNARNEIRQFVAMLLGSGYPVAEQLTGQAEPGGIQIVAYPMKADHYERTIRNRYEELMEWVNGWSLLAFSAPQPSGPYFRRPMSLAAGGRMKQPIYRDPYGIEAWEQSVERKTCRCFVTLADALQWKEITGDQLPHPPPTAAEFAEVNLPWLDVYAEDAETLTGSPNLALAGDLVDVADKKGDERLGPDGEVKPDTVIRVGAVEPSRA